MADHHFGFQLDWNEFELRQRWLDGPDLEHFIRRQAELTVETVIAGGAQRVLDVAAASATHSAELAARGVVAVALDPSPAMLASARDGMHARGVAFNLVRGVAEGLPFRDHSFDRVLCHSAIDHVADPDLAVREMTRVLEDNGRLVLSAVNYGGLAVRLSRMFYRAGRGLRWLADEKTVHQFWDSPVPAEHTFECTFDRLRHLCAPYLEHEHSFGVSVGCGIPAWGALLARLSPARQRSLLAWLDRGAAQAPRLADFIYMVFRPRPRMTWPHHRDPAQGGYVVRPDDLPYAHLVVREVAYWNAAGYAGTVIRGGPAGKAWANEAYTGDPARSWLDDLIARGPFTHAATLGSDGEQYEAAWLQAGGSQRLDIYELSPHAIRQLRTGLGPLRRRARFIRADLNFAELPPARYDVIWSSGCLHHIVNLEHLVAQVERALRPGGIFAIHDYVGERRLQFSAARLARVSSILAEIPLRFRRDGIATITAPHPGTLSPFCGMRPADLLPLAEQRFVTVHLARFGYLLPLPLLLDLEAMGDEDPALFARLRAAEAEASHDPALQAGSAYAVFRKR